MTTLADTLQPVMRIAEPSELLRAFLTPNGSGGAFGAADFPAVLYKIDSSGSVNTMTLVASLAGASVGAWAPFRAKEMKLATTRVVLTRGDVLALNSKATAWSGSLSLRLRRIVT